jgi:hypothetical protein
VGGVEVGAKDVEVPATAVWRREVDARLQHHLAISLGPHRVCDSVEDLGPGQADLRDIWTRDESEL